MVPYSNQRFAVFSTIQASSSCTNILNSLISVENPEPTQKIDDYPAMRRTASLDAIYLKGQWPRGTADYGSNLLLDKATQTPEEWMADLKR